MTGSLPLFEFSFLITEIPKEVFRGAADHPLVTSHIFQNIEPFFRNMEINL